MANVQAEFERLYLELEAGAPYALSAAAHTNLLKGLSAHLKHVKSNRACLCCLMRMADKVLTCGHSLCDICIQIFAEPVMPEKHTYKLRECVLCCVELETSKSVFRFIPRTAGKRVLSIDGGGVKGVIALEILSFVGGELKGLDCELRDFFDFGCGTSSGGLIILGIFVRCWTPTECLENFEALSAKIFRRRSAFKLPFPLVQDIVVSYLFDSKYPSKTIEQAFNTVFGASVPLFNPVCNGTKIAVTTTAVHGSTPHLLSNYNGWSQELEMTTARKTRYLTPKRARR